MTEDVLFKCLLIDDLVRQRTRLEKLSKALRTIDGVAGTARGGVRNKKGEFQGINECVKLTRLVKTDSETITKVDCGSAKVEDLDILFLHLGNGEDYGNHESVEYFNVVTKEYPNLAVVAYSGANAGTPKRVNLNKNWHRYFKRINGPQDFRLKEFFAEWAKQIKLNGGTKVPPPLYELQHNNGIESVFSILRFGYMMAHNKMADEVCKLPSTVKDRAVLGEARTESRAWWNPSLSHPLPEHKVCPEISNIRDFFGGEAKKDEEPKLTLNLWNEKICRQTESSQ